MHAAEFILPSWLLIQIPSPNHCLGGQYVAVTHPASPAVTQLGIKCRVPAQCLNATGSIEVSAISRHDPRG